MRGDGSCFTSCVSGVETCFEILDGVFVRSPGEVVVWIEMVWFLCVDFFLSFMHATYQTLQRISRQPKIGNSFVLITKQAHFLQLYWPLRGTNLTLPVLTRSIIVTVLP